MPGRIIRQYLSLIDLAPHQLEENVTIVDDDALLDAIKAILPALKSFCVSARDLLEWQETSVPRKTRIEHQRVQVIAFTSLPALH